MKKMTMSNNDICDYCNDVPMPYEAELAEVLADTAEALRASGDFDAAEGVDRVAADSPLRMAFYNGGRIYRRGISTECGDRLPFETWWAGQNPSDYGEVDEFGDYEPDRTRIAEAYMADFYAKYDAEIREEFKAVAGEWPRD